MALRRSFSKLEHTSIKKKALRLTLVVIMLFVLLKLGIDTILKPAPMHFISLEMKNDSTFILDTDTTNFDNFASILKEKVIDARKKHAYNKIEIIVHLPKVKTAAEIADLLKIVDAMDVQFSIRTKK